MGRSQRISQSTAKTGHKETLKPSRAAMQEGQGMGNRDLLSDIGAGHALPGPVQAKMESSMGADFSNVRLHESAAVAQGGAVAAASGSHVAFAPGKLNLSSHSGLELLGHELSHVASQARGEVSGKGLVNNSALEHRADADGARAAAGGMCSTAGPAMGTSSPGAIQCKKGKEKEYKPEVNYGQDITENFGGLDGDKKAELMCSLFLAGTYSGQKEATPTGYLDESEEDAAGKLTTMVDYAGVDGLFARQASTLGSLEAYYNSMLESGMSTEEAQMRAKYSSQGAQYIAPQFLLSSVGQEGENNLNTKRYKGTDKKWHVPMGADGKRLTPMDDYVVGKAKEVSQNKDLMARQKAVDPIVNGSDENNSWAREHPEILEELKIQCDVDSHAEARSSPRPESPKKKSLLLRMFKR